MLREKTLGAFEAETSGKSMLTGPNGIPGQCVGYMRKYMDEVAKTAQPSGKPGAKDQYLQYDNDPVLKQNYQKLGPKDDLKAGDIGFTNATQTNKWGHVFILTKDSPAGQPLDIIEQNYRKDTVGERTGVPRQANFLGALRPNKGVVGGGKIDGKAMGGILGAFKKLSSLFGKNGGLNEMLLDEFVDYSENYRSLKERQDENFLDKQLLSRAKRLGLKVSELLLEASVYINDEQLDALYEEVDKFQDIERRLREGGEDGNLSEDDYTVDDADVAAQEKASKKDAGGNEGNKEGGEQKEAAESPEAEKKKGVIYKQIQKDLQAYLDSKPRKTQMASVKKQILDMLGVAEKLEPDAPAPEVPAEPTAEPKEGAPAEGQPAEGGQPDASGGGQPQGGQQGNGQQNGKKQGLWSKIKTGAKKLFGLGEAVEIVFIEEGAHLRESAETSIDKQLLYKASKLNIRVSDLLLEAVPYIGDYGLEPLYEEIEKFQRYERRLFEIRNVLEDQSNGVYSTPEQRAAQASERRRVKNTFAAGQQQPQGQPAPQAQPQAQPQPQGQQAPTPEAAPQNKNAERNAAERAKTAAKNKVLQDIKNYLAPPRNNKKIEELKAGLLKILGVAEQKAPADPPPAAGQPAEGQPAPAPTPGKVSQKELAELSSAIEHSIPTKFLGNNNQTQMLVQQQLYAAYGSGIKSVTQLVTAATKGITNKKLLQEVSVRLNSYLSNSKLGLQP
jgi:post-segregation antitoxin (ccd killing protein)